MTEAEAATLTLGTEVEIKYEFGLKRNNRTGVIVGLTTRKDCFPLVSVEIKYPDSVNGQTEQQYDAFWLERVVQLDPVIDWVDLKLTLANNNQPTFLMENKITL